MNSVLARALAPALLLTVAACAGHDSRCAALPGGGRYCLQPTAAVAAFEVEQKVEATFSGRRETLIASIEADAQRLSFVGLTPFGHKLVHVVYNNQAASAITLADQRLDPALLLALLQLTLWPADAVRAGLTPPLTLEERPGLRRILSGDQALMSVSYTGAQPPYQQMRIALPPASLDLDVQSLALPSEVEPEP
ncbi:MAG: DUF3261 domain-containing protein [Burkholderiaceae bacterium]